MPVAKAFRQRSLFTAVPSYKQNCGDHMQILLRHIALVGAADISLSEQSVRHFFLFAQRIIEDEQALGGSGTG